MKNLCQGEPDFFNFCCDWIVWYRQAKMKSSCNIVAQTNLSEDNFIGTFQKFVEPTSGFWKALGTYWYFEQIIANNSRI